MQPLPLARVQVDRCGECGGLWFGFGQLAEIAGREVPFELLDGETARRCPDCTMSLTPVILEGGVPVETCSTCRGMWFDFADLQQLGKPFESVAPPPHPARYAGVAPPDEPSAVDRSMGFDCAKCGTRTPFAEGHGTSRGLVCGACVPKMGPNPKLTSADRAEPAGFELGDLLTALGRYFH